tara:strand:- start:3449 stop:4756 length:1308 start_codon:yes stop_codon:yes gene_type:complete
MQIPDDKEAHGLVVRLINHKYYLYAISLKFKDPYLEVEYDLCTRSVKLHHLRVSSIVATVFSCVLWVWNRNLVSDITPTGNFSKADPSSFVNVLWGSMFCIFFVTFFGAQFSRWSYGMNWNYFCSIFLLLWLLINSFYLSLTFSCNGGTITTNGGVVLINYLLGLASVENGSQQYIGFLGAFCSLLMTNLVSFIEFCLFCIMIGIVNVTYAMFLMSNGYPSPDQITGLFANMKQNNTHMADNFEQVIDFNGLIVDIPAVTMQNLFSSVCFWLLHSSLLILITRSHEKACRENFILKRVSSSHDIKTPALLPGDISIIRENIKQLKQITPPVTLCNELPALLAEWDRTLKVHAQACMRRVGIEPSKGQSLENGEPCSAELLQLGEARCDLASYNGPTEGTEADIRELREIVAHGEIVGETHNISGVQSEISKSENK